MNLFRWLLGLFRGRKSGYSVKTFWGVIKHYNKDGVQIGYTLKSFWGRMNRYDMNGNLVSYSFKNFWGGYNTYDAEGNLIRRSVKNIFGGFNTYDRYGKKIRESYKNFWSGLTHFDIESPDQYENVVFEQRKSSKKATVSDHYVGRKVTSESKKPKQTQQSKETPMPIEERQVESSHSTKNYSSAERHTKERKEETETKNSNDSYEKYVTFSRQNIDRTVEYYQNVAEYLEGNESVRQYAKILVFEYRGLKEFPALAQVCGNMVRVTPLIRQVEMFEFSISELSNIRTVEVTGLDMSVVDNEFITFGISKLAKEFEELFPDYLLGQEGISRTQCEFECGLIITEKSMEEIRKFIYK